MTPLILSSGLGVIYLAEAGFFVARWAREGIGCR